jgi:hypothetical protein
VNVPVAFGIMIALVVALFVTALTLMNKGVGIRD